MNKTNPFEHRGKVFNTPLEYALRALIIIENCTEKGIDIGRLVNYDYLVLHTNDLPDGPESLHPPIPYRSAEILIKRTLIQKGLNILLSKELIIIKYKKQGIFFYPSNLSEKILSCLNSNYYMLLKENVSWVINKFGHLSDIQLDKFMADNISKWGSEFNNEVFIREYND